MAKLFGKKTATTSLGNMVNGAGDPPSTEVVKIHQIIRSPDLQVRCKVDPNWVTRLVKQIKNGVVMNPITLVKIEGENGLFLVKGFHRVAAFGKIGIEEVPAEIINGSWSRAMEIALQSNDRHGMPLTAEDRRRKVIMAFDHYGWDASNNFIARVTRTYAKLVSAVRSEHEAGTNNDDEEVPVLDVSDAPAPPVDSAPSAPRQVKVKRGKSEYMATSAAPFAKGKDLVGPLRKYLDLSGVDRGSTLADIIQGGNPSDDHIENMRAENYFPEDKRTRKASVIAAAKTILSSDGQVKVDRKLWDEILAVVKNSSPDLYERLVEL